jgi:hypothetical protein
MRDLLLRKLALLESVLDPFRGCNTVLLEPRRRLRSVAKLAPAAPPPPPQRDPLNPSLSLSRSLARSLALSFLLSLSLFLSLSLARALSLSAPPP